MNPQSAVREVGAVAIVDLSGNFTHDDGCGVIRDSVKGLLESGRKQILVSLKDVTYIDSRGLGQLAGCWVTASRMGAQIKILNAQGRVDDALRVTQLFTVFVTFYDEAEAIRSF